MMTPSSCSAKSRASADLPLAVEPAKEYSLKRDLAVSYAQDLLDRTRLCKISLCFQPEKTTPGTIEQMVEFAHQASLQQIDIMSDASSTSHALQASCPHDWPWQQLRDEADKHQIDVNKLPAEGYGGKIDAC